MILEPKPKVERAHRARAPYLRVVEISALQIHDYDCGCSSCEPDRLTARHMGMLAVAGAVVGSAIMFAIDPAGAAAALFSTIGR